jgi:hypothetical protein
MDSIQRGAEVEQLLANPLLKDAFTGVREALIKKIETASLDDIEAQHELAVSLKLLITVRQYMENWIRDGQLEAERASSNSAWQKLQKRIGVRT